MSRPVRWRCLLALLLSSLAGCADPNKRALAGRYFTTFTEDGEPVLGIDDAQAGPVTLGSVAAIATAKGYVIALADSCYLYPAAASTAAAARRARSSLPDEAAGRQQIRRLTGDSLQFTSLLP